MKIRVFKRIYITDLQDEVNTFLSKNKNIKVLDINSYFDNTNHCLIITYKE